MTETASNLHYRMLFWCDYAERHTCPVVQAARESAVQRWNEYARQAARRESNIGRSLYDGEYRQPRFSRRRTLSEYDNRRDGVIVDRYYLGIYPNDYFG